MIVLEEDVLPSHINDAPSAEAIPSPTDLQLYAKEMEIAHLHAHYSKVIESLGGTSGPLERVSGEPLVSDQPASIALCHTRSASHVAQQPEPEHNAVGSSVVPMSRKPEQMAGGEKLKLENRVRSLEAGLLLAKQQVHEKDEAMKYMQAEHNQLKDRSHASEHAHVQEYKRLKTAAAEEKLALNDSLQDARHKALEQKQAADEENKRLSEELDRLRGMLHEMTVAIPNLIGEKTDMTTELTHHRARIQAELEATYTKLSEDALAEKKQMVDNLKSQAQYFAAQKDQEIHRLQSELRDERDCRAGEVRDLQEECMQLWRYAEAATEDLKRTEGCFRDSRPGTVPLKPARRDAMVAEKLKYTSTQVDLESSCVKRQGGIRPDSDKMIWSAAHRSASESGNGQISEMEGGLPSSQESSDVTEELEALRERVRDMETTETSIREACIADVRSEMEAALRQELDSRPTAEDMARLEDRYRKQLQQEAKRNAQMKIALSAGQRLQDRHQDARATTAPVLRLSVCTSETVKSHNTGQLTRRPATSYVSSSAGGMSGGNDGRPESPAAGLYGTLDAKLGRRSTARSTMSNLHP